MTDRLRLGELLVETKLITREQLEVALSVQKGQDGRRLGEILVEQRAVTESHLTQVLSQQLSVPWVSLQHIDFSRQLLNLVSAETAEKHGIVPIYVRRARNRQQTLYVAMVDPTDSSPLDEIAEYAGLPVRPMIAPASDIRAAVRAYYLGLPPEEQVEPTDYFPSVVGLPSGSPSTGPPGPSMPSMSDGGAIPQFPRAAPVPDVSRSAFGPARDRSAPPPPSKEAAPAETASATSGAEQPIARMDTTAEGQADSTEDVPPESEPLAAREGSMAQPSEKASEAPKMVTLTMLDGTEITLPAAPRRPRHGRPSIGPSDELTARDLIEALRAQAGGADASEVLGKGVSWESMFAALLSLLLKKHLVHDWEFVRELRR